jgi:hypothetical protein
MKLRLREFWVWFEQNANRLSDNSTDPELLDELDLRVASLDARLSWEIGPGELKPSQLVISPNLNRDLRDLARLVVDHAPVLGGWEFYAARPPKSWSYEFELGDADPATRTTVNASDWTFVLLEYPDKAHEILLRSKLASKLSSEQRDSAAATVLVAILGEDLFLDYIEWYELVEEFEPRFAKKERSIRDLRNAVLGS